MGDSTFPGQSTLATALGGAKTARTICSGNPIFQFSRDSAMLESVQKVEPT